MLTTETLANYLGEDASILLAAPPFRNWTFEKSVETGLNELRIDYVCAHEGMDFVCDGGNRVRSIFLYADEARFFGEDISDLPFTLSRPEIIARFGLPSKSGAGINDPILGNYGAWDRFTLSNYAVHIEYRVGSNRINKVTLMRLDVVK